MKDITNQKFGRLLAIRPVGKDKRGNITWECDCDCGNTKIAATAVLTSGKLISCGCAIFNSITAMQAHNRSQLSAFNRLYSKYKRKALKRGYVFELDEEQFRYITSSECSYCGIEPKQRSFTKSKWDCYTYNGVDRVDNNLGYTLSNCVPCCGLCNYMKADMPVEQFYTHIERIHARI